MLSISPFISASMPPPTTTVWTPPLDTPWQLMLDHALDVNNAKDMGLDYPSLSSPTTSTAIATTPGLP